MVVDGRATATGVHSAVWVTDILFIGLIQTFLEIIPYA